jgi:hypothetical protein
VRLPTQNLVPNLLLTLIEPMHVNNAHASQCDDQMKLAELIVPPSLKAKDRLMLLVVILDEEQLFLDRMRTLLPW